MQKENAILAFVDETLSDTEARALQPMVEGVDGVADCTFVTREEAKEAYIEQFDEDDLYSGVDASVFRHRYVIHLADKADLDQVAEQVEQVEGIAKIRADHAISNGFITLRNIAGVISVALIAILLIISVFIISNTIKLTTFDRRDEIAIMKMVGATNGFIRLPFVVEGLVLGILGGGLAFLAEWGIYTLLTGKLIGSLTGSFITVVPFDSLALKMFIAYMGTSILVGIFGALNAIRNYLKV